MFLCGKTLCFSYEKLIKQPKKMVDSPEPHLTGELFVKGRQIVKYGNKYCHLSCKGYSYAIRHFGKGKFVELDRGKGDREKYLSLKDRIQVLEKAPSVPIYDDSFWNKYFSSKYGESIE